MCLTQRYRIATLVQKIGFTEFRIVSNLRLLNNFMNTYNSIQYSRSQTTTCPSYFIQFACVYNVQCHVGLMQSYRLDLSQQRANSILLSFVCCDIEIPTYEQLKPNNSKFEGLFEREHSGLFGNIGYLKHRLAYGKDLRSLRMSAASNHGLL